MTGASSPSSGPRSGTLEARPYSTSTGTTTPTPMSTCSGSPRCHTGTLRTTRGHTATRPSSSSRAPPTTTRAAARTIGVLTLEPHGRCSRSRPSRGSTRWCSTPLCTEFLPTTTHSTSPWATSLPRSPASSVWSRIGPRAAGWMRSTWCPPCH